MIWQRARQKHNNGDRRLMKRAPRLAGIVDADIPAPKWQV